MEQENIFHVNRKNACLLSNIKLIILPTLIIRKEDKYRTSYYIAIQELNTMIEDKMYY